MVCDKPLFLLDTPRTKPYTFRYKAFCRATPVSILFIDSIPKFKRKLKSYYLKKNEALFKDNNIDP